MADAPRVARQSAAILLKWTAAALRGALFQRYAVDLPDIVEGLPAELPILEVRSEEADQVFLLTDGRVLHLEFQSVKRGDDLERFHAYDTALYGRHKRQIVTVILYGPGIHSAPDELDAGSFVYRVRIIFLGEQRGEDVLARLREKVGRGETFAPVDRVDMILLSQMAQSRPLAEVLRDAVRLAPGLLEEERTPTLGAMIGIAYTKIGDVVARTLLEEPEMSNVLEALVERGYEQGKAEGIAEGKAEGKRDLVRALVALRFGAVPTTLEARLAAADVAALDELFARAAAAQRVEEL